MRVASTWVLAISAIVLLCCGPARADSTLYIGTGAGTSCQSGCTSAPNLINGSSFDIFQGAPPPQYSLTQNPIDNLLVILAVPNDSPPPNITLNGSTGTFLGFDNSTDLYSFVPSLYGPTSQPPGFCTQTTAFSAECSALGPLPSNSLAELEAADLALDGITANGYGIYEFSVGPSSPGSIIQINGVNVPLGTFAFGYGYEENGFEDGTPFAQAGITTPEPGSLILLGSALLSMAGILRRRWSSS